MRILVFNPSVGSGKTTVAMNLAAALARMGEQIRLFDLDPEAALSARLSPVLIGSPVDILDPSEGAQKIGAMVAGIDGLSVIAGHRLALQHVEILPRLSLSEGSWEVMDAPSSQTEQIGELVLQSDLILIPVIPDRASIDQLHATIADLKASGVPQGALRLLINRYSNRMAQHQTERARLIEQFESAGVLPVVIRSSSKLAKDEAAPGTVFHHSSRSTGAGDFSQLARALHFEKAHRSRKGRGA